MKYLTIAGLTGLFLFAIPGLTTAADDTPVVATDGMELVTKDRRGAIYADPGVDWTVYTAIILDDATVAFRKNWKRDQNRNRATRASTKDMERIKRGLSEQFDEVFSKELAEKGGFERVTAASENVLRITPHIVDLDVYAPDIASSSYTRSYTDSAGSMTLKLELYDSETGDLIAVASDRREAPHRGYMQWTNSISNKADARQMFQNWAKALNRRLQEATGKSD
jgi:hypothetical protein